VVVHTVSCLGLLYLSSRFEGVASTVGIGRDYSRHCCRILLLLLKIATKPSKRMKKYTFSYST
jgi:hypothetical protein